MGESEARDKVGEHLNKPGHTQDPESWWDTPKSAPFSYLWKVVMIRGGFWGWAERKHHSYLQERQEGESRGLQTGHLHLNPGIILKTVSEYMKDRKMIQSSQLGDAEEIRPQPHNHFLQWNNYLVEEVEAADVLCLDARRAFVCFL